MREREENKLMRDTHLQHAAVVGKTFELISYAHAELLGARFHGATDHEAVARFKHVQRAGDGGEGHGAHKDGYFLVQATRDTVKSLSRLWCLCVSGSFRNF